MSTINFVGWGGFAYKQVDSRIVLWYFGDMKNWRFLDSGYADCYTNMAIDEAIFLEYASGNALPTLRMYGWKPAALSIGSSQKPEMELDLSKCQRENVSFVRRITGGGIIFHHNELTYSIACSLDDIRDLATNMRGAVSTSTFDISVRGAYKIICSFLIKAYSMLGLEAKFAGEYDKTLNPLPERRDGFCFASKELYDIVINGKKLGGNAQRRQKNMIFQHGSIPLKLDLDTATSFLKEALPALDDKTSSLEQALHSQIQFDEFKAIAKKAFEDTFSLILSDGTLTDREKKLAIELKNNKYKTTKWNLYGKRELSAPSVRTF